MNLIDIPMLAFRGNC